MALYTQTPSSSNQQSWPEPMETVWQLLSVTHQDIIETRQHINEHITIRTS